MTFSDIFKNIVIFSNPSHATTGTSLVFDLQLVIALSLV